MVETTGPLIGNVALNHLAPDIDDVTVTRAFDKMSTIPSKRTTRLSSTAAPAARKARKTSSMNRLVEGVRQFHEREFPRRQQLFAELADRQQPQTLFIACADSRIVPELITQTQPGELFVCRNIGNIVPAYGEMMGGVSAVVEYACTALGVTDIVVCGHTDCGAMKALLNPADPTLQTMPTVASWLRNAEAARSVVAATYTDPDDPQRLQRLVEQNVRTQLSHLGTHPAVAGRLAAGQLALHGWVYDIEGGGVSAIDAGSGALVPLASTTIRGRATAV